MNRSAPRTLIAALALLVLLGVALAAGCASTPSGSAATKTPTTAGTAAVTTAGSTSGSSSGAAAVGAVDADRLKAFIPKTAGAWKLESDPVGLSAKDANGKGYTWVTGVYQKNGDDNVQGSVQIHDLATAESPLKGMWQAFVAYEKPEGYRKTTTIKGFPAWDAYDKSTNNYSMMIGVGDRFIVYGLVEDGTKADLDTIVNAIDVSGLAALK